MGTRLQGRGIPETGPLQYICLTRVGRSKKTRGWKPEKRSKTALPTIGSALPANRNPFYRLQVLANL